MTEPARAQRARRGADHRERARVGEESGDPADAHHTAHMRHRGVAALIARGDVARPGEAEVGVASAVAATDYRQAIPRRGDAERAAPVVARAGFRDGRL